MGESETFCGEKEELFFNHGDRGAHTKRSNCPNLYILRI
jgi:hypothetical protein